jgi:3-deoxy-D-manno-octulosonic-acid transferase
MILFYHILTSFFFCAILLFLPLIWLVSEKRRANMLQRLGVLIPIPEKQPGTYRIWVHALSVGEVNSSLPFVKELKEQIPHAEIVFTASTRTGFEIAKRKMADNGMQSPVSALGYFPFDVWFCVLRVVSRIQPDLVCLVETDLWPGFLSIMKQRRVPVVLVNARLSQRSLAGYKRLGKLSALFFSGLSHVMTQTQKDANGFAQLGVSAGRLSVAGNMKFDQPILKMGKQEIRQLEKQFGILPHHRVWIAGSTHEGEEAMVVDAFVRAKEKHPGVKLILAPRDPKRCRQLIKQLSISEYSPACFSDPESAKEKADILFIDVMGELARAYALGEFAFVGGSLVNQGGHNPLEPAMFGKPVVFGPYMADFHEVESLLLEGGGAEQVIDNGVLTEKVMTFLDDPGLCGDMGEKAQKVFYGNSGALKRVVDKIKGGLFV